MKRSAMQILKEDYPHYYEIVMEWGMDYEVDTFFEKYIKEGYSEEEALGLALDDWDLI